MACNMDTGLFISHPSAREIRSGNWAVFLVVLSQQSCLLFMHCYRGDVDLRYFECWRLSFLHPVGWSPFMIKFFKDASGFNSDVGNIHV